MRLPSPQERRVPTDTWLEAQCRAVENAGRELALAMGEARDRCEQDRNGTLGRRRHVTESQVRRAEHAYQNLRRVQSEIQNALFDCEHALRELRERELSPAEMLLEADRLIAQYRFLRRRARIIDGLLAYLPVVLHHAGACHAHLRRLRNGEPGEQDAPFSVPDCGFALVALEALQEDDADR